MRSARIFVLSAVGVYLLFVLLVYVQQRELMYFPTTDRIRPSDVGLYGVEEVTLRTPSGESLYCWYGVAGPGRPTVLFFHGNGGSIANRYPRFQQLMARGFGVLVLGYPGYGGSDGSPSEPAFRQAAQLAYDALLDKGVIADDVIIYGESIGTGVAVTLAAANEAKALVLEAPMASAVDIAKAHYPYLPVDFILKDRFGSIDTIDKVGMPLLIIHGDLDQIIDIENGRQLFEKASEPKLFYPVKGAGHNNLMEFPITETVEKFIINL